jgi:hypothetical protein
MLSHSLWIAAVTAGYVPGRKIGSCGTQRCVSLYRLVQVLGRASSLFDARPMFGGGCADEQVPRGLAPAADEAAASAHGRNRVGSKQLRPRVPPFTSNASTHETDRPAIAALGILSDTQGIGDGKPPHH